MISLLIIGNGFDKKCELKSSFDDFEDSQYWVKDSQHLFWFFIFSYRKQIFPNENDNDWKWCSVEDLIGWVIHNYNELPTDISDVFEKIWRDPNISRSERLFLELGKFEKRFRQYLTNEVNESDKQERHLTNRYSYKVSKLLEEIKNQAFITGGLHIINFNYTEILPIVKADGYLGLQGITNADGLYCWEKIVENNVHGTLKTEIIIGIDDKNCRDKKDGNDDFKFSKTYRKMELQGRTDFQGKKQNLPDDVDQIIFFGHSLGKQDYSYFHSLFDYYKLYDSKIRLKFCFSKGHELTNEIYWLLHEYGEEFSNQRQGHNLLHKILLEGRLQIIKLK